MRICFIGDSFVNGTGDPECLGWTGRICRSIVQQGQELTYYNLGIRRETSTDIESRWLKEAACRLPANCDGRVVLSFGVNDMTLQDDKTRVDLTISVEATRRILSVVCQQYPVLMVSPAPVADAEHNLRSACLSERLEQLCREMNVPYLDVLTPLQTSENWMQEVHAGDGAHPGAAGYAELAKLVQNWSAWANWFNGNVGTEIHVPSPKRPRVSARALVIQNNAVLVIENVDDTGYWYVLPGGGQRYGEDLATCLKREVFEETGFNIKVGNIRFIREFIGKNHILLAGVPNDFHSVEITFACEIDEEPHESVDMIKNPDPHQVGWEWIDLDRLREARFYPRKMIDLIRSDSPAPIYIGDSQ
jgi:lysophospholipase L1-like esterase/8-oxo-dGTP pyrophosphatase MutT (NUDIX family)